MSTAVILAVLGAALLHACWNALIKGGSDKFGSMVALVLGHGLFAVPLMFFVPFPPSQAWGLIAVSVGLHLGYQMFLLLSYRLGDLSQVYPIARGSAPLIIACLSFSILSPTALVGVFLIAGGITGLGLAQVWGTKFRPLPFVLALTTGGFIASYSLVDAEAVAASGGVLSFYVWQSIANILVYLVFVPFVRASVLSDAVTKNWKVFVLGGLGSVAAYSIVLWAFTQAPVALVTAMRETSVLFALGIGVLFLGERFTWIKVLMTAIVLLGLAVLRLSA